MEKSNKIISKDIAENSFQEQVSIERNIRKDKLVASLRLFANYNFDEGIAGHITARDPQFTDSFWVNPFGMYFGIITADDLIRVNYEGEIVEGKHTKLNKAAFAMHSEIHRQRKDVNAVVHAHSIYGRIFSCLNEKIRPLTIEATPFYNDHILYSDQGGIYSELHEGAKIALKLNNHRAAILRNHGLLTVGTTVDSATWWFIALERSCQTQIAALSTGRELIELNREEAQRGYDELGNEDAGFFQYQPLYQKINSLNPDLIRDRIK